MSRNVSRKQCSSGKKMSNQSQPEEKFKKKSDTMPHPASGTLEGAKNIRVWRGRGPKKSGVKRKGRTGPKRMSLADVEAPPISYTKRSHVANLKVKNGMKKKGGKKLCFSNGRAN